MASPIRTIYLHAEAPAKPALGAPCNGCGLCCAAEPCPLGMLLSVRRSGRCRMLRWDEDQGRYGCGALGLPLVPSAGKRINPVRVAWSRLRSALVARWIAAGKGCDSDLELEPGTVRQPPQQPH